MSAVKHHPKGMAVMAIPFEARARAELRRRLADAVESMIAMLDALDADPDLEDAADAEPSLGWTKTMANGSTDDRECPDAEDST